MCVWTSHDKSSCKFSTARASGLFMTVFRSISVSGDPVTLSGSATASALCPVGSVWLSPQTQSKKTKREAREREKSAYLSKHTLGMGGKGKMLDGSGKEQEHPKPTHHGGQGQREEQEVTAAKEQGSIRGKLMGWKTVQDLAGAARPLHQEVSQLGGGGSWGKSWAGGCSGSCSARAGCFQACCSLHAPPPCLRVSPQVCNNRAALAGSLWAHEGCFKWRWTAMDSKLILKLP